MLLINKPLDWTSFDVVNKIRGSIKHLLKIKKIKVGHAGTLDPKADGLLIVCTGKLTKQIDRYQGMHKEYTGTIKLGATTPSFDTESEPDRIFPTEHITAEMIQEAAKEFIGEQLQAPPVFSAKKVDGKPAYLSARKGQEVKVKSKLITINEFEITEIDMPHVQFRIVCSKGTYIRSVANDFGAKLNSGGYLTALTRTRIGKFSLADATDVLEMAQHISALAIQPATT